MVIGTTLSHVPWVVTVNSNTALDADGPRADGNAKLPVEFTNQASPIFATPWSTCGCPPMIKSAPCRCQSVASSL